MFLRRIGANNTKESAVLDSFDITRRWPATHPDRIQLYSMATPNGVKVSTLLSECGLPFEAHKVSILEGDQMTPEFLSLNPNNKIPALIDPDGPDGQPIGLFESGAIMLYLAEKTGRFLSSDPVERYQTIQWLMWQMGGAGPMFGQFGFFYKFAGSSVQDPLPQERFAQESRRLLGVLDRHLAGRSTMVGQDYSIADIALWPWINTLHGFYEASERLGLDEFVEVNRWLAACLARPASQIGLATPA